MSESPTASAFWRFSLALYGAQGVAPACLTLQDEAGVDVNLLLFLLFLAHRTVEVTPEDVRRFDSAVRPWREAVVQPLRGIRRRLKAGVEPVTAGSGEMFRNQVKKVELESERLQQDALSRLIPAAAHASLARDECARRNVAAYAALIGPLPPSAIAAVLAAFDSVKL